MITYLNVPFEQIHAAKALGAQWNPARKQWYVIDPEDMQAFTSWIRQHPHLTEPHKLTQYEKSSASRTSPTARDIAIENMNQMRKEKREIKARNKLLMATEIKDRAEIKARRIHAEMQKNEGSRNTGEFRRSHDGTAEPKTP